MNTIKNSLSYQDDFNRVLQMAEDELAHLAEDARLDVGSTNDYLDSKAALGRVRECQAQMGRMTDEEYFEIKGPKCFYCGSEDIEGGHVQIDGGTAQQSITCNSCGMHWEDLYILAGWKLNPEPPAFVRDGTSDTLHPKEEEDE